MTRTWLQSYPAGVPAEIDPNLLRSLKELLEKTCALHAENVAYVQMGRTLSYRELDQLSRSFAAWLQNAGFSKGDRLAIMLPNTLQYVIAMFGALRAGVVVVNTNPLYTAPELEHISEAIIAACSKFCSSILSLGSGRAEELPSAADCAAG